MTHLKTPSACRNKHLINDRVLIPESPAMTRIGYGTGVSVYSMERSPRGGQIRSPWAIKRVNKTLPKSEKYEQLLVSEANILRTLKHPNIVGFRAFVETNDGRKCLAMEECEVSLADMIENKFEEEGNPFSEMAILRVALDISKALTYLHKECLLLHGDIKSHNILIKGNFEVAKLCDFGVCLKLNSVGVALPDQEYVGTECWCAPEILDDNIQLITVKSDLFSLGLVFWEMLALRPPHTTNISSDTVIDLENEDLPFVGIGTRPELPHNLGEEFNEVIRIFKWCTEEDPTLRPSAEQLQEDVEKQCFT